MHQNPNKKYLYKLIKFLLNPYDFHRYRHQDQAITYPA